MTFRTTLIVAITLLVSAILAVTIGGVAVVLERAARRDTGEALARSRDAFESFRALRESLHRSDARVVSEEPRLKAVVATEEVTHETVFSVAVELRRALQSDLFLITDGQGSLLADVADPAAAGFSLRDRPVVAKALAEGDATGIWTDEGHAYEIAARRVAFGTTNVGVVIVGYAIDDKLATQASHQTGSAFLVELAGAPLAVSSLEPDGPRPAPAAVAAAVAHVAVDGPPREVDVAGARYLAVAAPFAASDGRVRYVALRSLEKALAPARSAQLVVVAIGIFALAAAAALTVGLSSLLSRPIDRLVAFSDKVGGGDLTTRVALSRPREMVLLGTAMNRMVGELERSRVEIAKKERLEQELEISARIQTGILPDAVAVDGLEISSKMVPATEVGGDYYDAFPIEGGAWFGIGDVAGHGLRTGLIMLMLQSIMSSLGHAEPEAKPRDVLTLLNSVLYDNIRHRLHSDEHVTLTILRWTEATRTLTFAGAHEELVVYRAATGKCELVATPGTWVGAVRDVSRTMVDSELVLAEGDVLVLYTDGLTEAMDPEKHQFGLERLVAAVERTARTSCDAVRDAIFEDVLAFTDDQDDDRSVLVLRALPRKGATAPT